MSEQKDTFLWQALEEIDGFDGVLLPQDFYDFIVRRDGTCPYSVNELEAWLNEESEPPPGDDIESIEQHIQEINEQEKNNWSGNDWPGEEDDTGNDSHLHQCPYCYNLVSEEHEEFCSLNPNRNREIIP